MIFDSTRIVLYIKRNSIEIYSHTSRIGQIGIPPTVIDHLEVLDSQAYVKILEQLFEFYKIKNTIIVVILSEEVLFYKEFAGTTEKDTDRELGEFVKTVPFDHDKLSVILYIGQKQKVFIGVNKELYEPIQIAAKLNKLVVRDVLPEIIVPNMGKGMVFNQAIYNSIEQVVGMKTGNFLTTHISNEKQNEKIGEDDDRSEKAEVKTNRKHQIPLLVFSILLFLSLPIYLALSYDLVPANLTQFAKTNNAPEFTEQVQESVPSVTPFVDDVQSSESGQFEERRDLTIQVLNGSGVEGQAARVEGLLRAYDFDNIEVGNSDEEVASMTQVVFSDRVSEDDREDIAEVLSDAGFELEIRIEADGVYDIAIVTGSLGE